MPVLTEPDRNAESPAGLGVYKDNPDGAEANAVIYSLVQSAKADGVKPQLLLLLMLRDLAAAKTAADA